MFLNVDLDLVGRAAEVAPLVAHFEQKLIVLHVETRRGITAGHWELATYTRDLTPTLRGWLRLVEGLPRPARRAWDVARRKELNVGLEAEERAAEVAIDPDLLARIAKLGARLAVTVYAPDPMRARSGAAARRSTARGRGSP